MRCLSVMDRAPKTVKQHSSRRSGTSWETTVPQRTLRTSCKEKPGALTAPISLVLATLKPLRSTKQINLVFLLSKESLAVIKSELKRSLKNRLNISLNARSLSAQIAYHKSKTVVIKVYGSG